MADPKIKSRQELIPIIQKLRQEGRLIAFTNGCFDLLHVGHIHLLREAKKNCDILIVGLNSDSSVRALKGPERPLVPENQRAEILAAINYVDYVVIFNELDPLKIITEVKPDILVKGEDWAEGTIIGQKEVEARGGKVIRVPLKPGISTTHLFQKIKASN
ncbi:MAG: D-glycero-beta-D-manno-heptose 1-phosphate adenylyltransferase [Desulfobacterota bacterium]|nr:D-glycero-beta-D-manno-heptose 1-phosphate adenylyltransferase [Thermodesulfobacteriota bacterium]